MKYEMRPTKDMRWALGLGFFGAVLVVVTVDSLLIPPQAMRDISFSRYANERNKGKALASSCVVENTYR